MRNGVLTEVSFKPFYEGQMLFFELAGFLSQQGFEVHAMGQSMCVCGSLTQVDVLFGRR